MTMNLAPTAIDLDDFLTHLTPDLAAQIADRIPVGWSDQIHAAQRESVALIETAEHTTAQPLSTAEVDEWLRLGLLDAMVTWISGAGRTCLHDPDPHRAQPVWACAWKPHLIVCTSCMPLLKAVGDADMVCDCCGHLCTGLDDGDGIFALTVWLGGLAYQAGACRDCVPHKVWRDRHGTEIDEAERS